MMHRALIAALVLLATARLSAGTTLELVGEARLEVLFWSVYDSRLYAPGGEYHPDARPLRLEITYLRDIDADDLVQRTRKEWQQLDQDHPRQEDWLARLEQLWPDVTEDDTLTLELDGDDISHFSLNGKPLGRLDDTEFGARFLAIWLSPDTSRPALRRKLLGG